MGYHTSYAFTAPADIVSDLVLVTDWLAETLDVRRRPDATIEFGAKGTATGGPVRFQTAVSTSHLRLRWDATSGEPAWSGQLVVSSLPVGGSVIQVKLNLPVVIPALLSHIDQVVSQLLRRVDAETVRSMAATPARDNRSAA